MQIKTQWDNTTYPLELLLNFLIFQRLKIPNSEATEQIDLIYL